MPVAKKDTVRPYEAFMARLVAGERQIEMTMNEYAKLLDDAGANPDVASDFLTELEHMVHHGDIAITDR